MQSLRYSLGCSNSLPKPGFKFWFSFPFQLLAIDNPGRQQMIGQDLLSSSWPSPDCWGHLGDKTNRWQIRLISLYLLNKLNGNLKTTTAKPKPRIQTAQGSCSRCQFLNYILSLMYINSNYFNTSLSHLNESFT